MDSLQSPFTSLDSTKLLSPNRISSPIPSIELPPLPSLHVPLLPPLLLRLTHLTLPLRHPPIRRPTTARPRISRRPILIHRQIRANIIHHIIILADNLSLHRRIPLMIRAPRRSLGPIRTRNLSLARLNVHPVDDSLKHLQRYKRFVEWHFMSTLVDPCKRELACLFDLSVCLAVTAHDIREACVRVACGGKDVSDAFSADPVADLWTSANLDRYNLVEF
jgi:hypothetical protein